LNQDLRRHSHFDFAPNDVSSPPYNAALIPVIAGPREA